MHWRTVLILLPLLGLVAASSLTQVAKTDEEVENPKPASLIVGGIIAASALTLGIINTIVMNAPTSRSCAIGIKNVAGVTLENPSLYMYSGKVVNVLPRQIPEDKATVLRFDKTAWAARGAVGTLVYQIKNTSYKLMIMYHVPFDYNLFNNYYNMIVVSSGMKATKELHRFLERTDGQTPRIEISSQVKWIKRCMFGFCVHGFMTNASKSSMEIVIEKDASYM